MIDNFILKASTSKQAKYAVQCLNSIVNDESEKNKIFSQIIDRIKTDGFSLESPHFRIHLVTTGMISIAGGYLFFPKLLKTIMYKHVVQNLLLKDQRLIEEIEMHENTEKQRNTTDPSVSFEFLSEEIKCKIEAIKLMVRWIHGIKLNTLQAPIETQADEISKYHTVVENSMNLLMTIIKNEGDLNNKGLGGTTLERAHLRLAAGIAMIKIISNDSITQVTPSNTNATNLVTASDPIVQVSTSQLISPKQWHVLATLLLDPEDFVRERFAAKLNKNLITLSLSLEFLAMFCLAGYYEANSSFRNKLRTFLLWNLSKRRDTYKAKSNLNLKAILPECAMPYVIHLLAHMPFYTQYDDISQLNIVKECLWFFMEPLVLKNEYFSFSFYKKTFENIKMCVDKVSSTRPPENIPENEIASTIQSINFRIYSCCDLALGLIMSKTQNFLSRDFPIQPSLPGKYYSVSKEAKENNLKNYLPPSMQFAPPKRCSLENEILSKITKSFPSNTSSPNQSSRGRSAKNNTTNNYNQQIVLVSAEDIVDNVIDDGQTNLIQIDTDSNDQQIRIEDAVQINNGDTGIIIENDNQLNDKAAGTSTPPIIIINPSSQTNNTNSINVQTAITVNNTSATIVSNNVSVTTSTYSGTRSRKQDLNVLNDDDQQTVSKRQRVDSESSNGGRTTRTSTRKSSQDLSSNDLNDVSMEEDGLDTEEDNQPTKGRRGRPSRNSNSNAVTSNNKTTETSTKVDNVNNDNSESNTTHRKSSRISKASK